MSKLGRHVHRIVPWGEAQAGVKAAVRITRLGELTKLIAMFET